MLTATGLVLLMTPGLSFFYGGMVRIKNVVSTMLQSFVAMGVISLLWIVVGFSLAFGDSFHGLIGNPRTFFMFTRVGALTHPDLAPTIPLIVFALFQLKFAIITPALITGSFAERVRFSSYLLFMCLFSLFVYSPLAHWTWHPDGFLHKLGVLDFAGGTVVHMSAGFAALAGAMVLGRRTTHKNGEPHHAGEHPVRDSRHRHAVVRLVRLQRRLGAGGVGPGGDGVRDDQHRVGVGGAGVDLLRLDARPEAVGARRLRRRGGRPGRDHAGGRLRRRSARASSSARCASVVSNLMVHWKNASTLDDTLDVFPCHGVGGMVGMLMTGIFAKDVGLTSGHADHVPRALRRAGLRRGVLVRRLVGALQVHRLHHPAAGLRGAGRDRARPQPARRGDAGRDAGAGAPADVRQDRVEI